MVIADRAVARELLPGFHFWENLEVIEDLGT